MAFSVQRVPAVLSTAAEQLAVLWRMRVVTARAKADSREKQPVLRLGGQRLL